MNTFFLLLNIAFRKKMIIFYREWSLKLLMSKFYVTFQFEYLLKNYVQNFREWMRFCPPGSLVNPITKNYVKNIYTNICFSNTRENCKYTASTTETRTCKV